MSIFPMIAPPEGAEAERALPLCREAAWDFQRDRPIFRRGEPVTVSGKEAVRVWAWKALRTARCRYEIYSRDYGAEFGSLIGQGYSDALKEAEAPRYLRECLLVSPYITAVTGIAVTFLDGRLRVSGTAETVYGEVEVDAVV